MLTFLCQDGKSQNGAQAGIAGSSIPAEKGVPLLLSEISPPLYKGLCNRVLICMQEIFNPQTFTCQD